jgi:hypothetical protein
MAIKKELTKEERINKEERRLRRIYKDIPKDKLATVDGLIPRAAFMRVTLEDMEKDLDLNGFVELFSQSEKTDPYEKERVVARHYQQMSKNYQSISKQLYDLLPKGDGNNNKPEGDGFDEFLSDRK